MNRRLTDEDAAAVADELVKKLTDDETVEQVMEVWGRHIDLRLGRGLRRFLFWGGCTVLGLVTIATNPSEWIKRLLNGG